MDYSQLGHGEPNLRSACSNGMSWTNLAPLLKATFTGLLDAFPPYVQITISKYCRDRINRGEAFTLVETYLSSRITSLAKTGQSLVLTVDE